MREYFSGLSLAAAILLLLLSACTPDPPEETPTPPVDSTPVVVDEPPVVSDEPPVVSDEPTVVPEQEPSWTHTTSQEDCPEGYDPLTVHAEEESELEYLAEIDACASPEGTSTWINNHSSQVWRIYTRGARRELRQSSGSPATGVFRRADAAAGNDGATMEPDVYVEVSAPPSEVFWRADPVATGVYTQQVQIVKEFFQQLRDQSPEAFPEGRRRAMVTCGVAAYNLAEAYRESQSADTLAKTIESALGGAQDAAECRTAMQQADEVELRKGQIRRPVLIELDRVPKNTRIQQLKGPIAKALIVVRAVTPL
jgi:hypothetical protein